MSYERPKGASQYDFLAAREFEEEVGTWLGDFKVSNLTSPTKLDWWVPGFFLDVKEKRQPIGSRWPTLSGVRPEDSFIIDELSVRKAAEHFPHAYFLIRDVPLDRIFLARIDEMFGAERVRLNRTSDAGHHKGKWVVNLLDFRHLQDPARQLRDMILQDQVTTPWKNPGCVSAGRVREV